MKWTLSSWCTVDESLQILASNEDWRQYNGLPYSEEFMKAIAKQRIAHAEDFLQQFKEPRRLYNAAISTLSDAVKTELKLELYKAREEKLVAPEFQVAGHPVNWNNWRQFNAQAKSNADRKAVFDTLISKSHLVTPIIEAMFQKSKEIHAKYGTDPLSLYLEREGLSLDALKGLVKKLGEAARRPFQEGHEEYCRELFGKSAEYYDDLYTLRGRIFAPLDELFKAFDPATLPLRVLNRLDFEIGRLQVDTEDRPGKYTSAICFAIQVPNDVRLLVRPVKPFTDLESSFHEHGHGMQFISISESQPYWLRYDIPNGVAEVFSMFLESLAKNPHYHTKSLKISKASSEEALRRTRFMELFFLAFYAANSLMKIEFWERSLSMGAADEQYAGYAKHFLGVDMPGRYWQLHHVMPDYDLYSPSYMVAAVRSAELLNKVSVKFGSTWWTDPKSGKYLRELIGPGAELDLRSFSKLDTKPYLSTVVET